MYWKDAKEFVIERLRADGESAIPYTQFNWQSPFDKRCQIAWTQFTKALRIFYTANAAVTYPVGAQEVRFSVATICATPVYLPRRVWYDGSEITKVRSLKTLSEMTDQTSLTNGSPSAWGVARDYVIKFDRPVLAATGYVEGYAADAALTSDEHEMSLEDEYGLLFGAFAAVMFKSNVWSEQVGLERLKAYSQESWNGIMQIRGKQIRRIESSG